MSGSAQILFGEGLQLYRDGQFELARVSFIKGLAENQGHWEMHLYLGMTHARLGDLTNAKREFLNVRDLCPDNELRKRAASALSAISPAVSQQGVKKLSGD